MRNVILGVSVGLLLATAFSWVTTKNTVHAAVVPASPVGRFQLVQLHPSAATEWSGILDTQTGCTWLYTSSNPDDPNIKVPEYKMYLQFLGSHSFGTVSFDTTDYIFPKVANTTADYSEPIRELSRVASLCNKSRIAALQAVANQ